jgi:hypothetical protein
MNGSLNWISLEQVWKNMGKKTDIKVRFNDWSHSIRYFTIAGESEDGKRFVGTLDSGEKMSFSKKSRGWSLYYPESEFMAKAV